ncbi:hypothetical protein SLNWT_4901 [Streptomyces albus]|uniref:Uncharacterized protein n=1 Tax=Streptomyces albus (strain ATCC 21838 / DSM 41398 / FERM P-419 / JCM 4703 / NBRC 107858) TaxID=1081613 RepID=A0A0B5F4M8_STRA4|nr:hypothetical protein SLNWT_4901 [Streptomyces albus]AOU79584.1 hypothetical protein SLNHY_4893 [Streptomyces albus]
MTRDYTEAVRRLRRSSTGSRTGPGGPRGSRGGRGCRGTSDAGGHPASGGSVERPMPAAIPVATFGGTTVPRRRESGRCQERKSVVRGSRSPRCAPWWSPSASRRRPPPPPTGRC